jgi:hypothetical protein
LQAKVVAELYKQNLITKQGTPLLIHNLIILFVMSLVFISGWFLNQYFTSPKTLTASNQKMKYMLILQHPKNFIDSQNQVKEYSDWLQMIRAKGVEAVGNELQENGLELVLGKESNLQANQNLEPISGYFIISVKAETEAKEIAQTCPHLRYNGRVLLKKIIEH